MTRVLLISMPFGPITRPAIGISLLKPMVERSGIPCDIRYLNLFFAEIVGQEVYLTLSESCPTSALIGDWMFSEDLFGPNEERDHKYLQSFLPSAYSGFFTPQLIELVQQYRSLVSPYLDACMKIIPWEQYGIVGFTTTFQQTVASLALARRLKQEFPDLRLVFGGANSEGVMGQELLRQFPFLDAVFSGESDLSLPAYAQAALQSSSIVSEDKSRKQISAKIVPNLDTLSYPDYSDFKAAIRQHGFADKYEIRYLIEMSRGCWWAQKHQCNFCGLNGAALSYRTKSSDRVLSELHYLTEQYGAKVIWACDNILNMDCFQTLFPAMKKEGTNIELFFETKSNLRKAQLQLMKQVGINWFQPGIESLNTHVLELMKKGCTALQNIQLLKWARQFGMLLTWNILIGFPGETAEDYERMASYCKVISHLQPPSSVHPFRLDRFSPYFNAPETNGLAELKPFVSYSYIYPFNEPVLARLAYFFEFRYQDDHNPVKCAQPTLDAVAEWMQPESSSVLYAVPGENMLVIYDSRPIAKETQYILTGLGKAIYLYCDCIHSRQAIVRHLADHGYNEALREQQVDLFLADMTKKGLMLEEDQSYLSLAVLVESDTYLRTFIDPRSRRALRQHQPSSHLQTE
jgi:ribosomal peptide maturation radical SAM protein 1